MPIRKQQYEWRLPGAGTYAASGNGVGYPGVSIEYSIFVDGYGNNITKPPYVLEDQFVVIESFGSSPGVLPQPVTRNICTAYEYTMEVRYTTAGLEGVLTDFVIDGISLSMGPGGTYDRFGPTGTAGWTSDLQSIFNLNNYTDIIVTGTTSTIDGAETVYTTTFNSPGTYTQPTGKYVFGDYTYTKVPAGAAQTGTLVSIGCITTTPFLSNWTPNGFIQIVIEGTGYYQDPQHTWEHGISGDAAPYPIVNGTYIPQYSLTPPIYVLPEQTWDVRYTTMNDLRSYLQSNPTVDCDPSVILYYAFIQYQEYTGSDALMCYQLMDLGIPITVSNVEWYRKQLLDSRPLDTDTWEQYLEMAQAYREKERKRQKHYGRGYPKES